MSMERPDGTAETDSVPPPYRPRGKMLTDTQVRCVRDLMLVLLDQDLGLTARDAERVRDSMHVHRKHWERRRRVVAPLAAKNGAVRMMFEVVHGPMETT